MDFVKEKLQFRNSFFDLKWKNKFQKISFIFSNLINALKKEKRKRIFFDSIQIKIFDSIFLISNQKMNFKNFFHFSIFVMKLKNEK